MLALRLPFGFRTVPSATKCAAGDAGGDDGGGDDDGSDSAALASGSVELKLDEHGFPQLEAGSGDESSGAEALVVDSSAEVVAVESEADAEILSVKSATAAEGGAAVDDGGKAATAADEGGAAADRGGKAADEGGAAAGDGSKAASARSRSVSSSPAKFGKKGEQKAKALLNRALRKKPASIVEAPASSAKATASGGEPGHDPSLSTAGERKRSARGCAEDPKKKHKAAASYSHEASRRQYMCRCGSGPGSTKGFTYPADDEKAQHEAEKAAKAWCDERNERNERC